MPTDILVAKKNLRDAHAVETAAAPLAEGDARLAVARFALTANNVTYAAMGESFLYWRFFPAPDGHGRTPVWGFADVVESRCAGVPVGARVFGYFPMSSHLDVTPVRVTEGGFVDGAAHRRELPPVYNAYEFAPGLDPRREALVALFRPLFTTSFLIDDHFGDVAFHGAEKALFASASSKTALGAAWLMRRRSGVEVVGLTSARNVAFTQATGAYDRVIPYEAIDAEVVRPSVFVDMAGSAAVVNAVHARFGAALKHSMMVGATHWEAGGPVQSPSGVQHVLFFAPDHIVKRTREWGAPAFQERVSAAQAAFLDAADWLKVDEAHGPAPTIAAWRDLVDGKAAPEVGLIRGL
ncbi:MAG: DUF2855 family protein [Alphaproteobacteria bacterium]|nr:DUF2855 family protein [Alphaproteobacteria bacterium]